MVGLDDLVVVFPVGAALLRVVVGVALRRGVVEPEWHVDALDLLHVVSLAEALGQEDLAAVMVLRGVDRGLVVELERDHEVGREAAGELRRADDGVAAVGTLGDSRGLVRDGLGSAGRADVGVSEAGCGVGIELCRGDRIGGFGLLLRLLLRAELLDLPDGELRVAVVADEKPLAAVVAQRTPTGGALVVDALESHNRPPLLEGQRTVRHERRRALICGYAARVRLVFILRRAPSGRHSPLP